MYVPKVCAIDRHARRVAAGKNPAPRQKLAPVFGPALLRRLDYTVLDRVVHAPAGSWRLSFPSTASGDSGRSSCSRRDDQRGTFDFRRGRSAEHFAFAGREVDAERATFVDHLVDQQPRAAGTIIFLTG